MVHQRLQRRGSTFVLGIFLLLCSILAWSADPPRLLAPDPPATPGEAIAHTIPATPGVQRIDAHASGPGAFEVTLPAAPDAVARAFLVYELAGVPHWTATVRSINGLPALGGFAAVPSSGTQLQIEEINPRWLRAGVNQILFTPAPEDDGIAPSYLTNLRRANVATESDVLARVPYTVRELRLVYFDGSAPARPSLRLSHPVNGESDAAGTVLRGYVDPPGLPNGPAELFVNESFVPQAIHPADGSFSVFVPRTARDDEPWDIRIEVVYPDGSRLRHNVQLATANESGDGDAEDVAELDADSATAGSLEHGDARLDVTPGALRGRVKLTMRGLRNEELAALDSGMTNVTPQRRGFRLGPHGLRFNKAVELRLPYDPALIPPGMTEADVRTFFFDEAAGRWVPLPRVSVQAHSAADAKSGRVFVVSATDHFTDFINATLALPESPAGVNYAPTSIEDLAKADPASQVVQIAPPEGGPTGSAALEFPIVVPPGRRGMQPDLAVRYNSAGDNGWLGVGWDLEIPSIEISTAFGVPRYDGNDKYILDGEDLVAKGDGTYVRRIEGKFDRIVRHGSTASDFWWEITDKDGIRSIFGKNAQARLADPGNGRVFRWHLEQEIDPHGNAVDYTYFHDNNNGQPFAEKWTEVYPAAIQYTAGPNVPAYYNVTFTLDSIEDGGRPDRISSGRSRFKTYMRHRLASISVLAGETVVRRYDFTYGEGAFRKTLLQSIAVTGEGGAATFYTHRFEYSTPPTQDDGIDGFSAPQAWGGMDSGGDFTASTRFGGGAHGFVGVGPTTCQPHAGAQFGGGGSEMTQNVTFVDINGDGLPDRLRDDGVVDLNQYDPATDDGSHGGSFARKTFSNATTPGHTSEWNLDFALAGHAEAGFPMSVELSWAWVYSNDDKAVADIDGDLRPDLISTSDGFSVRRNNGHGFDNGITWEGFVGDGIQLLSPDDEKKALSEFLLSDAVRELRLPFDGRVTIAGPIRKTQSDGDGVDVTIYRGASVIWKRRFAAEDTAPCAPGPNHSCNGGLTLHAAAGDRLFFLTHSIRDTDGDALHWAPVVSYEGRDPEARDVNGQRLFVYDAAADFSFAGHRGGSWRAVADGTVRIKGALSKLETSDRVTLNIIAQHRVGTAQLLTRTFEANERASFEDFPEIRVVDGSVLLLQLSSPTPIDPRLIQWMPVVEYVGETTPGPLPDNLRKGPADVAWSIPYLRADKPMQPWTVPYTGTQKLTIKCEPPTGADVFSTTAAVVYIQGTNQLIQTALLSAEMELLFEGTAGEQRFFNVVGLGQKNPGTCKISDGTVPVTTLWPEPTSVFAGGHHHWFYGEWNGNRRFNPADLVEPPEDVDTTDWVAAVPRPNGTKEFPFPAWTGAGFDLYLSPDAVKPSRRGANAAGVLRKASGVSQGGGLSVLRKTSSKTTSASASAGVGRALSWGENETQLDLVDMNGDGYPDQVSDQGVRFSDGRGNFGDLTPFSGIGIIRHSKDGNVTDSIGLGIPHSKKSGKGKGSALRSLMPSAGRTISLTHTTSDLVDVNGDGLPDRISMLPGPSSTAVTVALNLGDRFGAPEAWDLPALSESNRCTDALDTFVDTFGADIVHTNSMQSLSFTRSGATNAGLAIGPLGGGTTYTMTRSLVELVDVNGDGLPDRVAKDHNDPYFRVQLNLGDRWDTEQHWYVPAWDEGYIGSHYNPGNFFGCHDAVSFSGSIEIQGSGGPVFCIPLVVVGIQIETTVQAFGSPGKGQGGGAQLFLEDLDGDGFADHILKRPGDSNVFVKRNQAGGANLLTTIHRPLGSTVTLSYERRGNRVDSPFSQWVLSKVSVDDGSDSSSAVTVTQYAYGNDAFYDRAERESYGFPGVTITRPDGSMITRTFLNRNYYTRHLQTREQLADAKGNLVLVETASYAEPTGPVIGGSWFPALLAETTELHDGTATSGSPQLSTGRTYAYDDQGNVEEITELENPNQSDDDVKVTIQYTNSRPVSMVVTDAKSRVLRSRRGTYDDKGNLIQLEHVLSGGRDPENGTVYDGTKNAVWSFAYDTLGNCISSTDPNDAKTTYTYETTTHTHPLEVTDPFGHVTTYAYDLKFGAPAATTDQNGNTIRHFYDAFGRLASVVGPYDTDAAPALSFEYTLGDPISHAIVHHKDATRSDTIDTATFIDSLERVIQTKEDAERDDGTGTTTGMRVSGLIAFDAMDRIVSEGQPVFDTNKPNVFVEQTTAQNATTFTYDTLDRVLQATFPNGAYTTVDYGFASFGGVKRSRVVRTDAEGRDTVFYRDLHDNIVAIVQTADGGKKTLTTNYVFDALDQLVAVTDTKSNVTKLEYDTLGRNTILDNPDLGRTEFRFDPAGNLRAKITANLAARGEQIRYQYTHGRLDKVDYPRSPDVLYTYGEPGAADNRANRIATVTDGSGVEERFYGSLGEVVKTVKTAAALNGNSPKGPYVTQYAYDDFDRLLSVVYPDGEKLTYGYDAGGSVKSATGVLNGNRFEYLRHVGYDAFGEQTRIVLGNGVETRSTYDAQTRLLKNVRTTVGTNVLRDITYQYDDSTTLLKADNVIPVPSPSLYGGPATQTFQYDDLVQLTGANGTYNSGPNKVSVYSLALGYDDLGNIVSKNQLHQTGKLTKLNTEKKTSYETAYTYTGKPHTPTRIGDRDFTYDANGNQTGWTSATNGTRRTLIWDEENRLTSVADNGQTTRFLYDADGTRTNKAGPHGETIYVNRWFSLRNGNIASKHVFTDSVRVATKVSPDPLPPSEKAYFFEPDHIGSTQFVTDELAAVYQHLEYFPTGEIWIDERSETQRTPHLFSGKELDEETGLSYFGYRYYDARQGQWISADPILDELLEEVECDNLSPAPFHLPGSMTGYVGNDPQNYTDPNGLTKIRDIKVGGTPGKDTPTGRAVRRSMQKDGNLKGFGTANERVLVYDYKAKTKVWKKAMTRRIAMGHKVDAVKISNGIGKFFGDRHKVVRDIMKDPDNYELEDSATNSSNGAKLKMKYEDEHNLLYDKVKNNPKLMKKWLGDFRAGRKKILTTKQWNSLKKHVPLDAH